MIRTIIALIALAFVAQPAAAQRVKDLGGFQGIRTNQLTGYGVVVGLPGTGDDNLEYTVQSMKGVTSRFGLNLPAGVAPGLKNAAVVMITADNRIASTRVADARIAYTGKGDVARASRQGWLSRFFQILSPF